MFIELKHLSSLEGKIIDGIPDKSITYVSQIRHVSLELLCIASIVTEIHLVALADCIKPYEATCNKKTIIAENVNCDISVFIEQIREEIYELRSYNEYRPIETFPA